MKNQLSLLFCIGLGLLLAGCGAKPRTTAESFYVDLAKGKISEAKKHCTEQTASVIDLAQSMGSIPVRPNAKFLFDREEISENEAKVYFREKEEGELESVDLVKIDGKWKVHISK